MIGRAGLSGLTIHAILDEAGVAPGTLYSYFSGKEEILEAIAERALAQYVAGVRETGAGPAERLDIVWDGLTRQAGSNTFVTDFERVGRTAVELLRAPLCTRTDRPTRSRR